MLAEAMVLVLGIIALAPIMFIGIGLSGVTENQVPWWFNLYFDDMLIIGLAAVSLVVTGVITLILHVARD
jgi:hypothetical protein